MPINTGIEACGPAWMWRGKLFSSTSRRQQPLRLSGAAPKHGCATHPALMEQAGSVGWHQDEALQVLGSRVLRVLLPWSLWSATLYFLQCQEAPGWPQVQLQQAFWLALWLTRRICAAYVTGAVPPLGSRYPEPDSPLD